MPQIRILLGYQQGQVFSLNDRAMVIGRDPKSTIVLHPDSAASRRHAEIFPLNGHWRVRDLGSVNGTALNGVRVSDEALRDKDEVIIGDNVFVFEDKDRDASQIAEAASHVNLVDSRGYQNRPETQSLAHAMARHTQRIQTEIGKHFAAKSEAVLDLLTALLAEGHVLIDDVPPGACAPLASALGEVLDLKFSGIKLTAEAAAETVVGAELIRGDPATANPERRFVPGPIFSQFLLADCIQCAPIETRTVLFEAMEHSRVMAGGQARPIEPPFMVIATRTSTDRGAAYPLSETHLDQFMFSVSWRKSVEAQQPVSPHSSPLERVLILNQILELQRAVRDLPVTDHVVKYAVRVVRATRPADKRSPDYIRNHVHAGAGPRAAQHLILAAKARAVIQGRLLVSAGDVRDVARAVLRHRIFVTFSAAVAGVDADQIVERLLRDVLEPA